MNLFKYRSLDRLDYVLDIILNERLYCAFYKDLNDPFEGLFSSTIYLSDKERLQYPRLFANTNKITTYKDVDDLIIGKVKHSRICSLSSSMHDVRMWSNYADGHRGVAIEIDFSDHTSEVQEVTYSEKLPHFDYSILSQPNTSEVFTHKTYQWDYEDEYRIINADEFYSVPKRIKAVHCGKRISRDHLDILCKAIPDGIPIYETKINRDTIKVYSQSESVQRST